MKISVNLNRIPDNYHIKDDFEKARLYFLKHGVDITWTFNNVDVKGYTSVWNGIRYVLNDAQLLVKIDPTADIDIFVFDQMEWKTPAGSQFPLLQTVPTGSCFPFKGKPFVIISSYIWEHEHGETALQIAHELMHALRQMACIKGFDFNDVMDTYFHNGDWDYPTGNFAQMWNILQPFIKTLTPTTMYKYFKPCEIVGLKPELVQLLDKARGIAGVPFIITSGFRTAEHNSEVGGVEGSSHTTGLAVDLLVKDSVSGGKILLALAQVGFKRFGFYKDNHIHADIATDKPSPCYWLK